MTPFAIDEYGMKAGEIFVHVYPWGDWHVGNRGFCESTFKRDKKKIQDDPLARIVLMGDLGEFISPSDKRFEPQIVDPRFDVKDLDNLLDLEVELISDELMSFDSKIFWGALDSNHSRTAERRFHNNVHRRICRNLGIPQWQYSAGGQVFCWESKKSKRHEALKLFAHHGFGGGRKRGAKVNRGDDIASYFDADLYLMGHVHDRIKWHNTKLFPTKKNGKPHIGHSDRMCVITGTYLRTYTEDCSGYGERAMYPPTSLGQHHVSVRWERYDNERVLVLE